MRAPVYQRLIRNASFALAGFGAERIPGRTPPRAVPHCPARCYLRLNSQATAYEEVTPVQAKIRGSAVVAERR